MLTSPAQQGSARLMITGGALLLLVAGGGAGFVLRGVFSAPVQSDVRLVEQRAGGARFTNPLLECDELHDPGATILWAPLQKEVEALVKARVELGAAKKVTVYFRELNRGNWFSVGEDHQYTPASLRKVPLLVALLKQAQTDPTLLSRLVKFDGASDLAALQNIKPSKQLEKGQSYPVSELLSRMIIQSDNNAYALLTTVVEEQQLRMVYALLGAGSSGQGKRHRYLSVDTYAGFYRILFNASYLDREGSDLALELLSGTEFNQGLVAGVPARVPVAHKFGEHANGAVRDVHDCGIIYYPNEPYLLCLMTQGANLEQQVELVRSISSVVYRQVDRRYAARGPRAAAPVSLPQP